MQNLLSIKISGFTNPSVAGVLRINFKRVSGDCSVYELLSDLNVIGLVSVPNDSDAFIAIRDDDYCLELDEDDLVINRNEPKTNEITLNVSNSTVTYGASYGSFCNDFNSGSVQKPLQVIKEGAKAYLYYGDNKIGEVQSSNTYYSKVMELLDVNPISVSMKSVATRSSVVSVNDTTAFVHETGLTAEQLEIIELLKTKYKFSIDLIEHVKKFWKKRPNQSLVIKKPKTLFNDYELIVRRAVAHIIAGKFLIFSGEASTGKNVCCNTICYLLQVEEEDTSMSRTTSKADLQGSQTIEAEETPVGIKQSVKFNLSSLANRALKGGCAVLDEFNGARPEELMVLHSLFDYRKSMNIAQYGFIKADSTFFGIGLMNEGYVGTAIQNPAFKSRFVIIKFNHCSLEGIIPNDDFGSKLISLFEKCREQREMKNLSTTALFIRMYEAAYDTYQIDKTYEQDILIEDCILNQLSLKESTIVKGLWDDAKAE